MKPRMEFSELYNNNFLESVILESDDLYLLDDAVEWIGDNLLPGDVFSEILLGEWAEDNGYRRNDE